LDRAARLRDPEAFRECLAGDLTFRDHRTLGFGLADRDELIDIVRSRDDLAPDWWVETLWTLAWNDRGRVSLVCERGTVAGGGPFENVHVRVAVTDGDRINRVELFAVDDAERALKRFGELCAVP
jgi:hypothetical protein